MRALPLIALAVLVVAAPRARAQDGDLAPLLRATLVKLQVTSQDYDTREPWKKGRIRTRPGRGFVIEPGVILTEAGNVADPQMIEVSVANSARRFAARLKHVDPEVGLALVEVTDEDLKRRLQPMPLGESVKLDDEFDIYQLGGDDIVERATARVVRAEAGANRLTLRVKTTLSDSGNGQIAVRDGKVVGLVTATMRSRQEGVILSIETIRKYLADFEDGKYDGCPGAGMWIQPLLRDDLRTYYGVGPEHHGIVVTRVMPGRTGDGIVRPGDVVLAVDGYDIDDEGKFEHERHGRLAATYLFRGRRYAGDKLPVQVLRDGKPVDLQLDLVSVPSSEDLVPRLPEGGRPQFLVVGGLVVLELNQEAAGSISRSPGGVLLRRYADRAGWDPPEDRRRIVYVDKVFADPANKGFERLRQTPIERVNGRRIREIKDVAAALEQPQGEFHVFEFEGVEADFVVPAARLDQINQRIASNYRVNRLRYLSGDPE